MPLNWLANLQYPDVTGAAYQDAAATHLNMQNKELDAKNALQQRMIASMSGGSPDNALLNQLAVTDPQAANALLKVRETTNPTPYSGEGFQNQLAGAQYRAYKKAGYSDDEAARLAGSDVMGMKQDTYVDAGGTTHLLTSKPLPSVSPRANAMIGEVLSAPPAKRQAVYKAKLKEAEDSGMDTSGMPDKLTDDHVQQLKSLYRPDDSAPAGTDTAKPVELTRDAGTINDNSVINSPKVKVARAEETAKLTAKRVDDWRADASAASDTIEDFKRVYGAYKSGFKGGPLAGYSMDKIKAKTAINQPLTQEEQEFANNYSLLESTAKINVAKTIKPIFGGNISDGERNFATDLQAAPLDIAEQGVAKAAVQEAGALQKIRKVEMLDEWQKVHGSAEAKNGKGQSFEKFYADYAQKNPVLTPEFMAERGAVVPVKTIKQAEELASGTRFIAPDGKIRVKK